MNIKHLRDELRSHLQHPFERDVVGDVDLARRIITDLTFCDIGGEGVPPVSAQNDLWLYSDESGTWTPLGEKHARSLVQMYADTPVRKISEKGEETYYRLKMSNAKTRAVGQAAIDNYDILDDDFFVEGKPGIAFGNGYVTVSKDGVELLDHSPDNRAIHGIPYDYDPDAPEPENWFRILDNVFGCDVDAEAKIKCLQEFSGALLVGMATQYSRCLLMLGGGENGKSTVSEAISELLFPGDLVTSVPPQAWGKEYNVARLQHSAINVCSEIPEADILNSAAFKGILTGDPTEARHPYGKPFSFVPRGGHLFSANRLPGTVDNSKGFWRRFLILTFNQDFSKRAGSTTKDDIKQQLVGDRAGIMVWGLKGAVRLLQQKGYTIPDSHHAELDSWQSDSNSVKAFIEDTCGKIEGATNGATLSELHGSFRVWCDSKGRKPMSDRGLAKRLREIGCESVRLRDGTAFDLELLPKTQWRNWG